MRPPPPVVAFATHVPPRAPSPRSRPNLSPRKVPSPRLAPITLSPPKGWIHHDNTWVKGQEFFIRCFPPEVEVVKPRTPVIVELPKDPLVLRKEELTKAFNEIDDDGNGYLEPHELKEVFVRAGYKVTDEQIETAMKALDGSSKPVRMLIFRRCHASFIVLFPHLDSHLCQPTTTGLSILRSFRSSAR